MTVTSIGILGFGKMGQIRAESVAEAPNVAVRRVFDVNRPDDLSFPFAATLDEIIEAGDIDAVFICLPNHLNKSTTIRCLDAGKHVFCEKPPAFSAADMREIIAAERRSGKVLMYGFNHRHHAAVEKMKETMESGHYGDILWMRGRYGKSVDADYLKTWRANKELAGGGILLDQGIHMLDLFLHLADRPFHDVHAFVSNRYWRTEGIEDNVFALLRNNDTGLVASLHSTMTQWRHLFSLEVFLERGYMVLNGLKTGSGTYGEEVLTIARNRSVAPAATWDDEERHSFSEDTSWRREAELFLHAVQSGAPVRYGNSAQALELMELIDRIYENDRHEAAALYDGLQGGAPAPAESAEDA